MSSPVRVGLFLTNQHRLGTDLAGAIDSQLSLVRAVRDKGWDSVFAGQHFLPDGMAMPQPAPFLARLSAESGELAVGIGILLLALHNPLEVAETWASVDIICGGRLIFGVGLGYRDVEYAAFGMSTSERVNRFERNLELVKLLWSDDRVSSDLAWCRLQEATLGANPLQQPRPPIWVAANADEAVRRAALLGDTWLINPHAVIDTVRAQVDLFRSTRSNAGLGQVSVLPAIREVYCAPTRALALERCRPYLTEKYSHYASWGQDRVLPGNESFHLPFEELERGRFIIGSPEDCLEQLLPWRDELGVNHFLLRTDWIGMPTAAAMSSIDLLTAEVLPVLRSG